MSDANRNLYPYLTEFLSLDSQTPAIKSLLSETLNTAHFPDFDDEEQDVYDWVLIKRKGVELGFIDKNYYKGAPYYAWFQDGAILGQIYYYSELVDSDVKAYEGYLPRNITWEDDRDTVLLKMEDFSDICKQSYTTDVWHFDEFSLTMNYNEETDIVERIVFHLRLPPLPQPNITPPNFADIAKFLSEDISDSKFLDLWRGYITNEELEQAFETDEINLLDTYGVKIHTSSQTGSLLLHNITFYSNRESDSVGWQGQLPFMLNFEDSPIELFQKINSVFKIEPREYDEEVNDGYVIWDFEYFSLKVVYSTFKNEIQTVSVMIPTF